MPEVREIKVKQMDQGCPKCGEGFMRPTGIVHPGPEMTRKSGVLPQREIERLNRGHNV